MEDFKEQYRQELIYQEIKSNRHTVKGFVWFLIAVGVIWLFTVTGFFLVDKVHVTIAFAVTFILFIPVFAVYWKGDLSKPWLKYFFFLAKSGTATGAGTGAGEKEAAGVGVYEGAGVTVSFFSFFQSHFFNSLSFF